MPGWGGLILNAQNVENEKEIVNTACEEIGTQVIQYIPRSGEIQQAEHAGGTVFEYLGDDSEMKQVYNRLAEVILEKSSLS